MSTHEFRYNLGLIKQYITFLKNQSISFNAQKISLIYYAEILKINLSNNMVEELLSL